MKIHLVLLSSIILMLVESRADSPPPPDNDFVYAPSRCPVLDIPSASIRMRGRGRIAKIRCWSGYIMIEGDRRLTCIYGIWKGRIPKCIRGGCEPMFIRNGDLMALYSGALLQISCKPGYSLIGSATVSCDGRKWNSSSPTCIIPQASDEHKACSFEMNMCGWIQDYMDNFDWKWTSASQNAFIGSLGPKTDHTLGTFSGHYIHTSSEEKWGPGTFARLFSPVLPMPFHSPACVVLYYHAYGDNTGMFNIYIKPSDVIFEFLTPRLSINGFSSDKWQMVYFELREADTENFQVILEVRGGTGYVPDIAVDDFLVTSGAECVALDLIYTVNKLYPVNSTSETPNISTTTSTSVSPWTENMSTVTNVPDITTTEPPASKTNPPVEASTKATSSNSTIATKILIPLTSPYPHTMVTLHPLSTQSTTLMRKTLTPAVTTEETTTETESTTKITIQTTTERKTTKKQTPKSEITTATPRYLPSTMSTTEESISTTSNITDNTLPKNDTFRGEFEKKSSINYLIITLVILIMGVVIASITLGYVYRNKRYRRMSSTEVDRDTKEHKIEDIQENENQRRLFISSYSKLKDSAYSEEDHGTPV